MTGIGNNLQTQPSRDARAQHRPGYLYYYKGYIEPATLGSVLRLQLHKDLARGYQVVPIAFLSVIGKYLQVLQR
jgi:hypothetical protein